MNEVAIRIIDTDNNVLGDLELANFTDFPLAITKGIVNLDNLKDRTGTYTKTFKVPNTKNNANLLSNVENINSRKDYRDALNRKPCIIVVNNNPIEQGFLQVSKSYNGFEVDSFELVFFGNNIDWVKGASELKMNEVTYENNTQLYDSANILNTNAQTSDTYDHCYPYISRGGNESQNNAEVRDFYPCFYLKSLIERGLNSLGWNVSSTFLSDANIKKIACDINPLFQLTDLQINATSLRAEDTTPATTTLSIGEEKRIGFDDDSNLPNKDNGSNFDTSTATYTVPRSGRYNINVFLNRFDRNSNPVNGAELKVVKSGDSSSSIGAGSILASQNVFIPASNPSDFGSKTFTYDVDLQVGDEVSIYMVAPVSNVQTISYNAGTYCTFQVRADLVAGDSYDLNNIIPDDIKLLDVINDFTRLFNIYYWTDIKTKTIYFEPRDTFFKAPSESIEWTNKIDISNKYEVNYITSYKRDVEFSYKGLNNDEFLKEWQNINKRSYGNYTHVLSDRFGEGKTKIELGTFSSVYAHDAREVTPLDSGSYNGEIVFTSVKIWDEYLTGGSTPDKRITSYNPRIFNFNNSTQTSEGGTNRKISQEGVESTTIPYAIFEDWNNTTASINLNFAGSDGLFSTYYSKMLKNIEEGGRLIAYFDLSSTDIENLDFRKLIYLDNDYNIRGYYLIESVIDYKPTENGLTKVSLFKFENLGSVAIDESQDGNNSIEDDNSNQEPIQEPIYIEDGVNLIEVWIENPVTGLIEPVYR